MNDRENPFEENLGRLLKAGCGPEVDVSPAALERLRAGLALPRRRPVQPADFPEWVLGFLTASVSLLVALSGACFWGGRAGLAGLCPSGPMLALVLANLIGIPVASMLIVMRRKYA